MQVFPILHNIDVYEVATWVIRQLMIRPETAYQLQVGKATDTRSLSLYEVKV